MMGHKTAAMDDRYTIIDDEALDVAVAKMNEYQKSQSMMSPTTELESQLEMLFDEDWNELSPAASLT